MSVRLSVAGAWPRQQGRDVRECSEQLVREEQRLEGQHLHEHIEHKKTEEGREGGVRCMVYNSP